MQCSFRTKSGAACMVPTLKARDVCWTHAPELREVRRRASSRGGKANRRATRVKRNGLPPLQLGNDEDLRIFLDRLMAATSDGQVPDLVARSMMQLCGLLRQLDKLIREESRRNGSSTVREIEKLKGRFLERTPPILEARRKEVLSLCVDANARSSLTVDRSPTNRKMGNDGDEMHP
jgi:hypothetical protein